RSWPSPTRFTRYWQTLASAGSLREIVWISHGLLSAYLSSVRRTRSPTANLCETIGAGSSRVPSPRDAGTVALSSGSLQIDRGGLALLAALDVVADLLTLVQASQAGPLHRRDVHEDVLRAIIRLDEAVTLLTIEPLNCT